MKKIVNYEGKDYAVLLFMDNNPVIPIAHYAGDYTVDWYSDEVLTPVYSGRSKNAKFFELRPVTFSYVVIKKKSKNNIYIYVRKNCNFDEIVTKDAELNAILNLAFPEMIAQKRSRIKFAREVARKAKESGVAFAVAICYRGDEEKINKFLASLQAVLDSGNYKIPESPEDLVEMNLELQGIEPKRLYSYVKSCLMNGEISSLN